MKLTILAAIAALLSACGGGGTDPPPATQQGCTPVAQAVVNIYGDSTNNGTMVQADGTIVQSVNAPPLVLQRLFDAHFGPMKVKVNNYAIGGTTLLDYGVKVEGLSVINHGINDSRMLLVDEYRAQLRSISPTFYETPSPVAANRWFTVPFLDAFVQVMRDVAAERGIPTLDTNAYVKSIPNWESLMADGVHPGDELYRLIATNVLYPAFEPRVAALFCK